jgi:hypothetical protein
VSIFLVKSHAKLVLALVLAVLVGCRTAPKREEQSRDIQITLSTAESSPSESTQSDDNCGLDDFPVSKSTDEILAAVPRDIAVPRNQMMVAKVAVNSEGRVTHLRVIRLAWPLRSPWLWMTALVALPFQVALIGIIVAIDRLAPYLAPNPIVFLFILWVAAWVEKRLMDQIADDYRP